MWNIYVNNLHNSLLMVYKGFYPKMAASWGFTLFLCVLLMVCRGLSLAGEDPDQTLSSSGQVKALSPEIDNALGSNHGTTGEGGHAVEPITTLPIVSWKWYHVTTPYLVALWILVSWLCKLGESCKVLFLQGSALPSSTRNPGKAIFAQSY